MDEERSPNDGEPADGADAPTAAAAADLGPTQPARPLVEWAAPPPQPSGAWQYDVPTSWTGLDVTSVFRRTIDTFLAHWGAFVALTIPSAVLGVLSATSTSSAASDGRPTASPLYLVFLLGSVFVTTSIAMAADDARSGKRVSAVSVLGPALRRSAVAVVSAIVVGLILIGLFLVPLLVIGGFASARPNTTAIVVGGIVILVLIGVAFYGLFRWSLAPIAIAIDGAGPLSALNRSWRVTKGSLWRLGVLVIGVSLLTAPWAIAGTLFLVAGNLPVSVAVSVVGTLAFGALITIMMTIAYGDITGRWRTDGPPLAAPDMATSEPAAAPPEPGPPVAWAPAPPVTWSPEPSSASVGSADAATTPAPPSAWPTDLQPTTPASPATPPPSGPVSRTARRAYVIGVLVVGLVLVVPSIAAVVPAFGELGFAAVPAADRGKILAGTSRDATDPCVPLERATTFDSSDAIYIGGYFNRAIAPGGSATVHVFIDDQEAAAVPLAATTQMVGCYYEQDALIGLSPADYRLRVDDEAGVLAEGTFTVK